MDFEEGLQGLMFRIQGLVFRDFHFLEAGP